MPKGVKLAILIILSLVIIVLVSFVNVYVLHFSTVVSEIITFFVGVL